VELHVTFSKHALVSNTQAAELRRWQHPALSFTDRAAERSAGALGARGLAE